MERLIIGGCQGGIEVFFCGEKQRNNRGKIWVKQEVKTGANGGGIDIKQGWRSVKKKISPKWAYFS